MPGGHGDLLIFAALAMTEWLSLNAACSRFTERDGASP
jgi:hypothetical protein